MKLDCTEAPGLTRITCDKWSIEIRNLAAEGAGEASVGELVGFMLMGALGILEVTSDGVEDHIASFHQIAASVSEDTRTLYTAEDLMGEPPTPEEPTDGAEDS
tara:strand:+ start:232 stop:540 length:309 start_codon:yes stop_codon:yes gene_type:complete